ncbi:hypothetical protein [Lentzea sp. NEAU-D7]|uniref:hypothetical protein n=1 Tax=Lentzea sp. NEAU-D7 TaxID=2994667 RepID=UPI00224A9F14|nr:hypothetical protein [Lentzea sp. NEAU-D7]MCX2949691.1 hypothetical protein [Lentzea sp. NEAU-D7]
MDGTGYDAGDGLCDALATCGIEAATIDPFEIDAATGVAVLLLPLRSSTLPTSCTTALSILGRVAADPAAAFSGRLVLVWYLRRAARARLSPVGVAPMWNASELLLATSWSRELAKHHDEHAAAQCRSTRVSRMVQAPTHFRLGVNRVPDVLRTLRTLDANLLHSLCVEVGPVDDVHWSGAESVAAAVRARA